MKKQWLHLGLTAALAAALTLPAARAWERHDLIFDQTEMLHTAYVDELSTQLLPDFTEQYGVELQVDVMMDLGDYADIVELAQDFYQGYDYGYGEGRSGVSLTLLVHEDADGLALDDWYVYAGGDSWELTTNGPANGVQGAEPWLSDGWPGDLEEDRQQFELAVTGLKDSLEAFILAGGAASTIYDPNSPGGGEAEPGETAWPAGGFVYDTAGLLTGEEAGELSALGQAAAEQYGCGLYIVTVDDYRDYADDIEAFSKMVYTGLDFGVGEDDSGCLLLLSMADRDYRLLCHGYGNTAFTDYGKEYLADAFLEDFGSDDWYNGFGAYLYTANEMLELSRTEEPVDVGYDDGSGRGFGIVLCILLGLGIALIVRGVLHGQMKSVAAAGEAKYYVNQAGTDMDVVQDLYTHTTQSRVYDPPKRDNDSGGGGGTTIDSDGFSSSGGKF